MYCINRHSCPWEVHTSSECFGVTDLPLKANQLCDPGEQLKLFETQFYYLYNEAISPTNFVSGYEEQLG